MGSPWLHHLFASNFVEKEALAQAFSCEFCEILKNTFFTGQYRATASANIIAKKPHQIHLTNPFLFYFC